MIRTLREDINEVVVRHLSNALLTGEMVNVPDWVDEIVQSLADMILQQTENERARLVAHAHKRLDYFIREKKGH